MSNSSCKGILPIILGGLAGLAVGAVAASGIFWILMQRQQARHEAELAATAAAVVPVKEVGELIRPGVPVFDMREGDDSKVKKAGTEFIEDLQNNRLQSAYRSMTPEFQKKNTREQFDAMIAEYPAVRNLASYLPTVKVRRGDGESFEFYVTHTERGVDTGKDKVNFALTLTKISDEWRIAQFEITVDSKPKKK